MVSNGSLTISTRFIECCGRRQDWMVDGGVLIQVGYEASVTDAGVVTVARRLLEERLSVTSQVRTAVAMFGKRLVALL
jgi:hypothetical protein